jgi:hypothetical protein
MTFNPIDKDTDPRPLVLSPHAAASDDALLSRMVSYTVSDDLRKQVLDELINMPILQGCTEVHIKREPAGHIS